MHVRTVRLLMRKAVEAEMDCSVFLIVIRTPMKEYS
jgi:hypothetical protein